jgi:hypothetical protein
MLVMGSGVIITMGSIAIGTFIIEKILNASGKITEAQLCNIAGFSLLGTMTLVIVINLLGKCRKLLG